MKLMDFRKNFLKMKGDARNIARGVALGTFIGMTPFPGFRMMIAIALARLFHMHKTAAALSVYSNNALTGVFISAFNYYVGMKILHLEGLPAFPLNSLQEASSFIFHSGLNVFLALSVGGVVVGIPFAAIMYFLSFKFFKMREQQIYDRSIERHNVHKELAIS